MTSNPDRRLRPLAVAAAALLALLVSIAWTDSAEAHGKKHRWGGGSHGFHYKLPPAYYLPPPVYYGPPPAYYGPPPGYYLPPPRAYYGVPYPRAYYGPRYHRFHPNLGLRFNFRF